MFGLHYIKTEKIDKELGKFYSDIFDKRQTGDYEDFIDFSSQDVSELIPQATELIGRISQILKS